MDKDIYTIGMCKYCKENRPLKNGVCADCKKKQPELPDFLKDIFGGISNE